MSEQVEKLREELAAALARDLRQLDLDSAALFVERQQAEIKRLRAALTEAERVG